MIRRCKICKRGGAANQPQSRRVDTRADAWIAAFQADQGWNRHAETFGPHALRFAPPTPGYA
jgi:hypothetical protein